MVVLVVGVGDGVGSGYVGGVCVGAVGVCVCVGVGVGIGGGGRGYGRYSIITAVTYLPNEATTTDPVGLQSTPVA